MIEREIYDLLLEQLSQKDNQINSLIDQIKILSDKVDYLTRKMYGAKSEKRSKDVLMMG